MIDQSRLILVLSYSHSHFSGFRYFCRFVSSFMEKMRCSRLFNGDSQQIQLHCVSLNLFFAEAFSLFMILLMAAG